MNGHQINTSLNFPKHISSFIVWLMMTNITLSLLIYTRKADSGGYSSLTTFIFYLTLTLWRRFFAFSFTFSCTRVLKYTSVNVQLSKLSASSQRFRGYTTYIHLFQELRIHVLRTHYFIIVIYQHLKTPQTLFIGINNTMD